MNRKRKPKSPRLLMRELWAYVARGPGEPFEGILAMLPPMTCLPLVAADLARVQSLLPRARMIASMFDCPFRILHFPTYDVLGRDAFYPDRQPGSKVTEVFCIVAQDKEGEGLMTPGGIPAVVTEWKRIRLAVHRLWAEGAKFEVRRFHSPEEVPARSFEQAFSFN